jgi:hypothetical protein
MQVEKNRGIGRTQRKMKWEAGRWKKFVQGKIGSLFGKKTDGYFHKRVEPGKEQFFL